MMQCQFVPDGCVPEQKFLDDVSPYDNNKINAYIFIAALKVVGNEKYGGLRFLQLLGISLGPWRSMSIFVLNMPFAIEKRISFSALSSKMNRRFV
jgi:hypothetical protein